MSERTIDWGGSNSPYETHVDRDGNDRVILAEDTDGNTVLLEWDGAAGEWVYGGPVNMDGADVSNVGTLDASVIDTGELSNNGDLIDVLDALSRQGLTDGSTVKISESDLDADHERSQAVQVTTGVGTTDTEIIDFGSVMSSGQASTGGFVVVHGRDNNGTDDWQDIVHFVRSGPASTVSSVADSGAASRSYSVGGSKLSLSMGADTSDVIAIGDGFRVV